MLAWVPLDTSTGGMPRIHLHHQILSERLFAINHHDVFSFHADSQTLIIGLS